MYQKNQVMIFHQKKDQENVKARKKELEIEENKKQLLNEGDK
jgi:hypothetical protein